MAHQPHDPIGALAVSPNFAQDGTVFAATAALSIKINAYVLLKSTDGGVTWLAVPGLDENSPVISIAFSPAYAVDQAIFVAGNGGLFKSNNQGASWKQMSTKPIVSVVLSPNFAIDNTLFVITNTRNIFKSTNRGTTLSPVSVPAGLTGGLSSIALSPNFAVDNTILLGSQSSGIFQSTNGGASWTNVTPGMILPAIETLSFSPLYATDRTAFAGTLGSGALISTNGGAAWAVSSSGLPDLNISSFSFSPTYSTDGTLWVTTGAAGVFQSNNSGATWTLFATVNRLLSGQSPIHYQTVAAANGSGGTVLFLGMYEGLWTALAGANAWQYIDTIPTRLVRSINISPNYANDHTIFCNTYGGGNLWSIDGGTTWTFQNTGMQNAYTDAGGFSPNYTVDGMAFSSMGLGLQRSSDWGATWQMMADLGAETYPRALAVSPNFASDSTVMIGTDNQPGTFYPPTVTYQGKEYPNQGLFLSQDGGNNWIPTSLGGPPIVWVAISPAFATDRTAFAASPQSGIYKSTDGGNTWNTVHVPASSNQMAQVVISPNFAKDRTVFVAVITGGIYKSLDGGTTWTVVGNTSTIRALDIAFSPNYAKDQLIFAGTVQSGLLRSKDGGNTFVKLAGFPDNFVSAVGISPNFAKDSTLFAAGYHGIYKSTNRGTAWTYTVEPARIEDSRNAATTTDQQPPSVVYQGSWAQVTSPVASANSYMITSEAQDTATLSFTGTGVRLLTWTGPSQGAATLQLDGGAPTSISLNAATDQYQQNVFEQHGIACGNHAFTVTAQPGDGQTVSVDAFDVWVDTCPFFSLNLH